MKAAFRRLVARLLEHQVKRLVARHRLKVVAVAGSVGKTSTKMAVAAVLAQKYRTHVQEGNYNSEIGLPLSIFGLRTPRFLLNPLAWCGLLLQTQQQLRHYPFDVLVLELGTDHPGEIARYQRYLSPDVAVITAITPEHMANFPGGMDQVAAEELSLVGTSKITVANYDDIPATYRRRYLEPEAHEYYGLKSAADYRFEVASMSPAEGVSGTIMHGRQVFIHEAQIGVFGLQSLKPALAAVAVGQLLDLSKAQIAAGLAHIRPVSGRMNLLPGLNQSLLIDDTYNSSPEAAVAALEALGDAPAGRRIAVMGSMNELGDDAPQYHETVGTAAAGVDLLVTIGDLANTYLGPAAVAAGLDPSRYQPADSPYAAGEYLRLLLLPGDVVLLKGSQNGVFAEETTKLLLADPNDALRLVRQSPAWLRLKAKQFARPSSTTGAGKGSLA